MEEQQVGLEVMSIAQDARMYRISSNNRSLNDLSDTITQRGVQLANAPRVQDVVSAMEKEGLLDRWVYAGYLKKILSRYQSSDITCWEVVRRSPNLFDNKAGVLRYVLEELDLPYDRDLAVLVVSGAVELSDVRAMVLEIELQFGANNWTVHTFPIPDHPGMALLRVLNPKVAVTVEGRLEPGASWQIYFDREVGVNVVSVAELEEKVNKCRTAAYST